MSPLPKTLFLGERIRVEQKGPGVLCLVLARPELRNAFDPLMVEELCRCLTDLAALPPAELRVLLLVGDGKAFCAGADLAYMRGQADQSLEANLADARRLGALLQQVAAFPAPVLCGVQGAAVGGGFGLVACADVVVAHPSAIFALSEVRLGIVPAVISPFVVRKLGLAHAGPLMLSGRRLEAAEAISCGLIHKLVATDSTLDATLDEGLAELLEAGPEAARRTKALLLREIPLPDAALAEYTAHAIAEARCTQEARAGFQAFFAKAPAPWSGRS